MNFQDKWYQAVKAKKSVLCLGIDPADPGQRSSHTIPTGVTKRDYCLQVIKAVADYTPAIKINHHYVRDLSQQDIRAINDYAHSFGMVSIDDCKVADIGDTNQSAFYHSAAEGFDAITFTPFSGTIEQATVDAHAAGLGLITLALMSNPEFQVTKQAQYPSKETTTEYIARQVHETSGDGIVLGAPSPKNHITNTEVDWLAEHCPKALALVPGVGAQGGDAAFILQAFGQRAIINVGRSLFYSKDPAAVAKELHSQWLQYLPD